jgi:L-glyceraldehyde 3-phosphate reductase
VAKRIASKPRSYGPDLTRRAATLVAEEKVLLFIYQLSYSILNRRIEPELLATLDALGTGCIAFSRLAKGMLTSKYLGGIPADARASRGGSLAQNALSDQILAAIRTLNDIAGQRGQTLAQMAIAWVLRDTRMTSALIGACTVEQLDDTLDAASPPIRKQNSRRAT